MTTAMDLGKVFRVDPKDCSKRVASLSPRERQVAHGLSHGMTKKGIAADLGISPRTVEVFVRKLKTKFGLQGHALHGVSRIWFCAALHDEANGSGEKAKTS